MKCAEADAFIHAYVDGELAGVDRDTYERHILECDHCFRDCRLQARFKAALRGHLPRPEAPEALKVRLAAQLALEPPAPRWPWQRYPRFSPAFAAALALVVLVMGARNRRSPIVSQALRTYQAAMPLDVMNSDCRQVAQWFRQHLDFAVKPPPVAHKANCQGGRVVNIRDRFAAYFEVLTPEGHKLGVLVHDGDEPIEGADHRVVNGLDIELASARGSSVMAFRDRDGLSYVVTGDLDQDHLTGFLPASLER
jgi:anti-sigma factor RsiW